MIAVLFLSIWLSINLLFKGSILRSEIDGCIQMKNFVAGHPEVKIALNEDFFVGKSDIVSRGMLTSANVKGKNNDDVCNSVKFVLMKIKFISII